MSLSSLLDCQIQRSSTLELSKTKAVMLLADNMGFPDEVHCKLLIVAITKEINACVISL